MSENNLRDFFIQNQGEIPTWEDDSLTKVKNRASFDVDFPRLRGNNGLLIVDVDYLKESNKKFGHDGADQILRFVALGLEKTLRETEDRQDPVYRYGGDEFVIFLPNVNSRKDLEAICNRVHKVVTQMAVPNVGEGDYKQGLSIGATLGNFDGNNNMNFFKEADQALYKAKDGGRNRVVVAE